MRKTEEWMMLEMMKKEEAGLLTLLKSIPSTVMEGKLMEKGKGKVKLLKLLGQPKGERGKEMSNSHVNYVLIIIVLTSKLCL